MNKKMIMASACVMGVMLSANVFADEVERIPMEMVDTAVSGTAFYHKADGTTETKSVYYPEEEGYEDDFWIENSINECRTKLQNWIEQYDCEKTEVIEDIVVDYVDKYEINLGDYGFMPLANPYDYDDDGFGYDDGLDDDYFMPTNMIVEVTEIHQVYTIEVHGYEAQVENPDDENEENNENNNQEKLPKLDDEDNRQPQTEVDNTKVDNVEKAEEKVQENVTTSTEQNPNTSDPILYSLGLFGLSSLGIIKKIRK